MRSPETSDVVVKWHVGGNRNANDYILSVTNACLQCRTLFTVLVPFKTFPPPDFCPDCLARGAHLSMYARQGSVRKPALAVGQPPAARTLSRHCGYHRGH